MGGEPNALPIFEVHTEQGGPILIESENADTARDEVQNELNNPATTTGDQVVDVVPR